MMHDDQRSWMRVAGRLRPKAETVEYRFAPRGAVESGAVDLGPVPLLVRPVRLGPLRLVAPIAPARVSVREITVREPRLSRLWERFCIDIGVAAERDAAFFERRVFQRMKEERYRVLIVEDGDRYAVRAACVFTTRGTTGYVLELLHDRTVAGMRAASRLAGIAVRELADAGAAMVHAWSLASSGSFPMLARHAFVPMPARALAKVDPRHLVARALDDEAAPFVTERDRWYVSLLDDDRV